MFDTVFQYVTSFGLLAACLIGYSLVRSEMQYRRNIKTSIRIMNERIANNFEEDED